MNADIRPATREDAESICDVIRRSITSCCSADHRHEPVLLAAWLANKTPGNIVSWLSVPNAQALVAIQQGGIVGVALLSGAELTLCYVAPEALHQGIGKALLRQIEASAIASGRHAIHLSSTQTAQDFYRRNGFIDAGAIQHWGGLQAQPMSKSLIPQAFQTDRLTIRAPRPGDGLAVHQAVVESLAALRAWPAYLPWAMHTPSPDASEQFCRQGHAAFLAREDFPMLVFLKEQDVLVGATGLHRLRWDVPKCEVGYWGRRSHARQGLITEAVTGIAQFAFRHLGVLRIECLTDATNQASRTVAERAGFSLESVMRHERRSPDGSLRDTCVYAKAPPT